MKIYLILWLVQIIFIDLKEIKFNFFLYLIKLLKNKKYFFNKYN